MSNSIQELKPVLEQKPAKSIITRGVIYSAINVSYVKEAISSAKSFKKVCPDIPITLYTDHPEAVDVASKSLFEHVIKIDMKEMKDKKIKIVPYAKLSKIRSMSTFPYDITLYLDCDTKVVRPIYELFELGKTNDIVIANSPKLDKSKKPYTLASYVWPKHYNSGMIIYSNNERVKQLFKSWQELVLKDKNIYTKYDGKFWDQPKLVELLNAPKSPIKLKVVVNTLYNARGSMLARMKKDGKYKTVKIVHKH